MSWDLTANVDANTTGYERHLDNAIQATRRYEASLNSLEADMMALERSMDDNIAQGLQRQNDALDQTGRAFFTFGAAVGIALGLAANEAIKWEAAWAGVTKTTTGSAEEMAQLEEDLRSLALVLPATHEEIAATAEAAGQLGIARKDLADFTKTALDLGETTNLSAEEAATGLAQLMNVMGSAPDVIDELGSTLVALGNDGASTEAQILSMAQRLTGAVKLIGGSEADVLGLASAMANLGIQSELGGGAMSRTILGIYKIVQDGGPKLDEFARFSGTSAEAFASAWEADPVRALDMFIQGMARTRAEGGNLIGALEDMGFKGTQNMQVLLRLAGAGSELTDALDGSAKAWEQIAMARNQLRDSAIDIGAVVLPALVELLEFGGNLIQTWSDLPGPIKDVIVILGIAASAVGIFGGAAMIAIPKIAAFRAAVVALEAGALKTAGTRLAGMATFLMGPYGLALAGAATAVMLLASAHGEASREIEEYKRTLDDAGNRTNDTFSAVIANLQEEGWVDYAKSLGISMEEIVSAVTEGGDALDLLKTKVDAAAGSENNPFNAEGWTKDASQFIDNVENGRSKMSEAEQQAKELAEANTILDGSTNTAATGQDAFTTALEEGADATGELNEEVKTLKEQLEEISGAFLNNREAGRSVRDGMREIRKATREFIKENGDLDGAFKPGTKSGDEFASMLDGLAQDLQGQVDATAMVSGSYEATMRTWRKSRDTLIEVAQELGMTEKQAKRYAEQILGTPELVKTYFQAETAEANGKIRTLVAQIDAIDRNIVIGVSVRDGGGDIPFLSGGTPDAAPRRPGRGGGTNGRVNTWGAAGQQLGGVRTPRVLVGSGGGGGGMAPIDYDRLASGIANEFRSAADEANEAIGRGIARESRRPWTAQAQATRAAGLGGRPTGGSR